MTTNTYRPLQDDDPVGTEVYTCGSEKRKVGTLLCQHRGSTWVAEPHGPVTWDTCVICVRVTDPWGELLEAAKAIQGACYLDDNVLQRKGVTTIECAALVDLFAAIAAVEAAKKGASDDQR